jgi:hypothetical protein
VANDPIGLFGGTKPPIPVLPGTEQGPSNGF